MGKKAIKKIITLILAGVLLLGTAGSVFADNNDRTGAELKAARAYMPGVKQAGSDGKAANAYMPGAMRTGGNNDETETLQEAAKAGTGDSDWEAESSRAALEEYVKELLLMLDSSNATLDMLYNEIAELDMKIAENQAALDAAMESADSQRLQMLKRIKYFYEAGNKMDVIEAIFSAGSIGEAINRTSYINTVVDYDREMLNRYVATINEINDLQQQLIEARERLLQAKNEFEATNEEMLAAVEEIPEAMAEFGVEEKDVYQVIEDVREEMIETGELPQEAASEAETEKTPSETITETATEKETETTTEAKEETTTRAEEEKTASVDIPEDLRGGQYSDQEIYDMARVTYLENGCAYPTGSYRSIYLTACVILNRAENWYGGSINSAIYDSGQYATAYRYKNWGGGPLQINDITWQAVREALAGCDPNPYYQCNGQHLAGMGLTEYYRDPESDEVFYYSYDNVPEKKEDEPEKKEDSGSEGAEGQEETPDGEENPGTEEN